MERNREARRVPMAAAGNGSSRRSHRAGSFRDGGGAMKMLPPAMRLLLSSMFSLNYLNQEKQYQLHLHSKQSGEDKKNLWVFTRSEVDYAAIFYLGPDHLSHREIWKVYNS